MDKRKLGLITFILLIVATLLSGVQVSSAAVTLMSTTSRISVASDGSQANDSSWDGAISDDGRFVVFTSAARNLVPGDSDYYSDIFLHDRQTGTTEIVSVASDGTYGNGTSRYPTISGDGRFIAFMSEANNLVPNDTNDCMDVFLHDRHTGQTTRISYTPSGGEGNDESDLPALSSDGRFIAFYSDANNLVPNDINESADIFVYDRFTNQITLVSVASDGTQGDERSTDPDISADGRFVTFSSRASNFIVGDPDPNWDTDVFIHDRLSGQTTLASVSSDGIRGNSDSWWPAPSEDGRYVAFFSYASNLVSDDTNAVGDIFVYDRETGQTSRVSISSNGTQGNATATHFDISSNGQVIAFESVASNLVSDDTNGFADVFVHDRSSGQTTRVSVASDGSQGNGNPSPWPQYLSPSLSADGRLVAFHFRSSNLVPGDTNNRDDVFVHDRGLTDAELAALYSPYLAFHEEEIYWPIGVEPAVTSSNLHYRPNHVLISPTIDDLGNPLYNLSDSFLNFPGTSDSQTAAYFKDHRETLPWQPRIYARVKHDGNSTVIQYWFFYFANPWLHPSLNYHEGDWEMIQVHLLEDTARFVAYAQHEGGTRRVWEHIRKHDTTHPLVYVARGSHASYFGPYRHIYVPILNIGVDESGTANQVNPSITLISGTEPWLAFLGRWGNVTNISRPGVNGPLGPNLKTQWDYSESWGEALPWDETHWSNKPHCSTSYPAHSRLENLLNGERVGYLDDGTIVEEIATSEYIDNPLAAHRTALVNFVESGSWLFKRCVVINPTTILHQPTLPITITVNVPDSVDNSVIEVSFEDVMLSSGARAEVAELSDGIYILRIDQDNDGTFDEELPPTSSSTATIDLTPPGPVSDLAALVDGTGSVSLTWTAPGDDAAIGTAASYDLRRDIDPITSASWMLASTVPDTPTPAIAGTLQTMEIDGLPIGRHYFAIRAIDEQYQLGSISNLVYVDIIPLEVQIESFTATPRDSANHVMWATVSELDILGFNLWRGDSPENPQLQLNPTMIPSSGSGGGNGAVYEWFDDELYNGTTYWYWLDAVDTQGNTQRFGPVSATPNAPTAIALSEMTTNQQSPYKGALMGLFLLSILVGCSLISRRQRKTVVR